MAEETEQAVELELRNGAKAALQQIVALLGNGATEAEAVQRALGTELYLLEQVIKEKATLFLETKKGRVEINLFNK